jgi:DNA-binding transcriptional regulator YbjK
VTDRRAHLTDAAIVTLAQSGMRGLTHRAVDRAASLPEGSTSYYFRTREALLIGTMERLAELGTADIATVSMDDLDSLAALLSHWLTAGRDRMLARFELTLESARRPVLRSAFEQAGHELRAMAAKLLVDAGAPDPVRRAANLVALIDGLIFDSVAGAGPKRSQADLRDALVPLLEAAFAS